MSEHIEDQPTEADPLLRMQRNDPDSYPKAFMRTDEPMSLIQLLQALPAVVVLVPIRVATFIALLLTAQLAMLWWRWTKPSGSPTMDLAQADSKLPCRRLFGSMARAMLFVLGFYSIEVVDERSEEERGTGVVVSNHLSFIDVLVHCAMLQTPSFVAKEAAASLPFFGHFFTFMSCLLVPARTHQRESVAVAGLARRGAVTAAMVERQQCFDRLSQQHPGETSLPTLVVFPEGTTSNGVFMLPFRSGAFVAGLQVTPVCISYPHSKFNLSWETIPTPNYLARLLLQYRQSCKFHILPVYTPSQEETEDARLFAANVRQRMIVASGVGDSACTVVDKQTYHAAIRRGETSWTSRLEL